MVAPASLLFEPFRLDLSGGQLWCNRRAIALRPKTFALLRYLAEHPGQLATKDELLDAVWGETAVSDHVLKTCVRELREALGDDARTPRFLETVHRRGYRFRAPVRFVSSDASDGLTSALSRPGVALVGRDAELTELQARWDLALRGERQIVLVTGEPGIGKTALVDAFLSTLPMGDPCDPALWIGRGQCIEQYGAGEAYLPILDALGRLCRTPGGEPLVGLLARYAPSWLVQMPALLDEATLTALRGRVAGTTGARMLREMAEALDALASERPVLLWIEDLHWSDVSTLDLVAMLARRRERARLLLVATYRPVDVIVRGHPLREVKRELELHGQCTELPLPLLTVAAVEELLRRRGDAAVEIAELARAIHRRTEGNPLFVVNVLADASAHAGVASAEAIAARVPDTLRQMIEGQIERLDPSDRGLLEAASVAGPRFSTAVVAAGLGMVITDVEERCAALAARGQFLRSDGSEAWPDGTVAATCAFVHALNQEVLYAQLPAGRRAQLHRGIGQRLQAAYGIRMAEIAATLAEHFERGQDPMPAIFYRRQAGENALRRSAHREATDQLTRALSTLAPLPRAPELVRLELALQLTLAAALAISKGHASSDLETAYGRAQALAEEIGEDDPFYLTPLTGNAVFRMNRGELRTAYALLERLRAGSRTAADPNLAMLAYGMLSGVILLFLGELAESRRHLEECIPRYDPSQMAALRFLFGNDPGISSLATLGVTLTHLGYADRGWEQCREALRMAEEAAHPFSISYARLYAAWTQQLRGDAAAVREHAEALITLSTEHGFTQRLAQGRVMRGWALAVEGEMNEALEETERGLAEYRETGAELSRPYFLTLLADVRGRRGETAEGLDVLAETRALVESTDGHSCGPEVYRLNGALLLAREPGGRRRPDIAEAERFFQRAIEIARGQESKILELRAAVDLGRLWKAEGRIDPARALVAAVHGWFSEGLETADVRNARSLLADLA